MVHWESTGRAAASSGPAAFPGVFSRHPPHPPPPTPTPHVGSAHSVPLRVGAAIAFRGEGNSSLISMDARFAHTAGAVLPCQSPGGGRPAARRADEPAADWPPAGGRGLPGGRAAAYSNRVETVFASSSEGEIFQRRQTARRVQYPGNEDYLHGNFCLMMPRRSLGRLILPDVPGVTVNGKKRQS